MEWVSMRCAGDSDNNCSDNYFRSIKLLCFEEIKIDYIAYKMSLILWHSITLEGKEEWEKNRETVSSIITNCWKELFARAESDRFRFIYRGIIFAIEDVSAKQYKSSKNHRRRGSWVRRFRPSAFASTQNPKKWTRFRDESDLSSQVKRITISRLPSSLFHLGI